MDCIEYCLSVNFGVFSRCLLLVRVAYVIVFIVSFILLSNCRWLHVWLQCRPTWHVKIKFCCVCILINRQLWWQRGIGPTFFLTLDRKVRRILQCTGSSLHDQTSPPNFFPSILFFSNFCSFFVFFASFSIIHYPCYIDWRSVIALIIGCLL